MLSIYLHFSVFTEMQVTVLVYSVMLLLHDLSLETRVTHVCLSAQNNGNMLLLHDFALETRVTHVCFSAQNNVDNLTVVVPL